MKRWTTAALALALLSGAAGAQQHFSGKDVEKRTESVLAAYDWKASLEEACAEAREKGRMVYWLQIVGDLDGGL